MLTNGFTGGGGRGFEASYSALASTDSGDLQNLARKDTRADTRRDGSAPRDGTQDGQSPVRVPNKVFYGKDPAGAEGGATDTLAGGGSALPETVEEVV